MAGLLSCAARMASNDGDTDERTGEMTHVAVASRRVTSRLMMKMVLRKRGGSGEAPAEVIPAEEPGVPGMRGRNRDGATALGEPVPHEHAAAKGEGVDVAPFGDPADEPVEEAMTRLLPCEGLVDHCVGRVP